MTSLLRPGIFLLYGLTALLSFILSKAWLGEYIYGDQFFYRIFYVDAATYSSFQAVSDHAQAVLGAREPISVAILWLGARLQVDKDVWISLLNSVFVVLLLSLCRRYRLTLLDTSLLLGNYYFIALLTSVERLKLAFLLISLGLWLRGRWLWLCLALAPLAHTQTIIILLAAFLLRSSEPLRLLLRRFRLRSSLLISLVIMAVSLGSFYVLNSSEIGEKYVYYSGDGGLPALVDLAALSLVAFLVTADRFRMSLALMPPIIAGFLVGGARVNIMAFLLVASLLVFEARISRLPVRLLLVYFLWQSVEFVLNIYTYGNGYGPV